MPGFVWIGEQETAGRRHGILQPIMASCSPSWWPAAHHGIQQPIMASYSLSWHPTAPHGILQPIMTTCSPSWHPTDLHSILQLIMASCSPPWHPAAHHGILQPFTASCSPSWYPAAPHREQRGSADLCSLVTAAGLRGQHGAASGKGRVRVGSASPSSNAKKITPNRTAL